MWLSVGIDESELHPATIRLAQMTIKPFLC